MPRFLLPIAALPLMLTACGPIARATHVATGFASHQLCSAAFVSRVEPEAFYREAIVPTMRPLGFLLSHKVDHDKAEVTATFAGLAESRSVYRGGLGCLLVQDPLPAVEKIAADASASALLPEIAGPGIVEPSSEALKAALDKAFAENAGPPYRNTKAVVVVHDGRVIAERYAAGYGIDTQVIGWSATKSVTNALIGILVRQGKLSVSAPAPVAAWSDPKDPRHVITIDNLLRMNSGLDIGQSLTASASTMFDPSAHMVFGERDMAAFAGQVPLKFAPGGDWNYTNGNTLLLSRLIRDNAGRTAASTLEFVHRELFDKLGMHHATLEFDSTGTPIGSSHMLASPRDWARFGLLYLDDGVVGASGSCPKAGWTIRQRSHRTATNMVMAPASGPTGPTAAAPCIVPRQAFREMPSWRAALSANMS